jgi:hypothetical protein
MPTGCLSGGWCFDAHVMLLRRDHHELKLDHQ